MRSLLSQGEKRQHRTVKYQTDIVEQAKSLMEKRQILYKMGRHLGVGNFFVIEISSYEGNLCIAAFDSNSSESLMIEIKPERKQFILEQFREDYEMMANSL